MNAGPTCYRLLAATAFAIVAMQSPGSPLRRLSGASLNLDYGKLPLAFEPNVGQSDPQVRFLARGGGMTTFFTGTEAVMVLSRGVQAKKPERPGRPEAAPRAVKRAVVRMKLDGAAEPERAIGLERLPGISNYFIGNDPAKWRTDVPHFGRIQYEGVYPGIDLVWYGNQRQLEYDFIVAPGSDPHQIQVAYSGVESLEVDARGDLVLRTALGEMRQQKPRVYQEVDGRQVEVGARYAVAAHNRVSFALAGYDRTRQLRIDPVMLVYSTYLGGSSDDFGFAIGVDGAGSAYITGETASSNFPTQSPYQPTLPQTGQGISNAFVTKFTPAGDALAYSTYLGGSVGELGLGIVVDSAGSAYITGLTYSSDFPTRSAYRTTLSGSQNAFVTKLAPAGNALDYSTYLGGNVQDAGNAIAVDSAGSAYVTGFTKSTNFPTQSPYQATLQGTSNVFVTKLTPAGSGLVYSTYLGGNNEDGGSGIAVDAAGSAYIAGQTDSTNFPTLLPYQAALQGTYNAFVTKLTPAGNALTYSTFLGGSSSDFADGIAVDGGGSAYIAGYATSTNFPTQSPYQATLLGSTNAFVTKLTPAGSTLAYSTYLGGSVSDEGNAIAVDSSGAAYITGITSSSNFPVLSPYQATLLAAAGGTNAFVTKLAPAGNALAYSTYLGGGTRDYGNGIALDGSGSVYVAGYTTSSTFPTGSPYQAASAGGNDVFLAKLAPPVQYALTISASPAAGGTVTPASGTLYNSGTVVPVTASANTGYVFVGWTGTVANTANASTTVTMSAAESITANFSPQGSQTQTITFNTLSSQVLGVAAFTVSAIASSNLAVSFASTTMPVCTVSGTTVTLVAVGTCTIQATQTGNTTYAVAAPVNQSFMVYSPCDLKQTGSIGVADVQLIINEALGVAPAVNFLAGGKTITVVDVQIEINAALGLGCAAK